MDNLDELRRMAIFVAAVDGGSFSEAARRLGLTRSAVSRQIGLLEERLGVRLLQRTTRSFRLTEAGEVFYARCAQMVRAADAAVEALQPLTSEPSGALVVTAPLGPGERYVAPALASFLARHPRVRVELIVADEVRDLVAEGIDVAIRAGQLADSSLIARRLAAMPMAICASPAYLARRGEPTAPGELADHEWIVFSPLGSRLVFRRGDAREVVSLSGRARTNNGAVIRRLLLDGHGLSLLPRFYIEDELADGRLRAVLEDEPLPAAGIYALYPAGRHLPLKARAFIDHLASQAPPG